MFDSLNRCELCRLSRCNFSWSLCTQRTTCSQIATTPTPWMLWWLVTASPSSSSSVTFIIRATSGRRRSRNETPWWGNTQLKHNGLKKIHTYIYMGIIHDVHTLKVYFLKKKNCSTSQRPLEGATSPQCESFSQGAQHTTSSGDWHCTIFQGINALVCCICYVVVFIKTNNIINRTNVIQLFIS